MFGWNVHNQSDRIKIFLFLLFLFLVVGFGARFLFEHVQDKGMGDPSSKKAMASKHVIDTESTFSHDSKQIAVKDQKNAYDQTEHFSKEILATTKETAVQFVTAFHPYKADQPMVSLEKAKPYMTEAFYKKMKRNGRREVLERSNLTVKNVQVTPVVNKSTIVVRWNVMVTGEAKSVDGTKSETEDWYLISLRSVDGEWKVEDVRVNVPN
jgi:hypothetical protein